MMRLLRTRSARISLCALAFAAASLAGLPLPGATVVATQGTKKFTTTSDQGGVYSFADLPDGNWQIEVEMQCFVPVHAEVAITPTTPAGAWNLTLLPLDQIMARTKLTQPLIAASPAPAIV